MDTTKSSQRFFCSSMQFQVAGYQSETSKRRSSSPIVSRRFKRTDQPPEFLVKPRRICVELGQNAKFRIAFEGWPIPEVNWNHNGQCLSDDNKYKIYKSGQYHFLEVLNAAVEDGGAYDIKIENTLGDVCATAELNVYANLSEFQHASNPRSLQTCDVPSQCGSPDLISPILSHSDDNGNDVTFSYKDRSLPQHSVALDHNDTMLFANDLDKFTTDNNVRYSSINNVGIYSSSSLGISAANVPSCSLDAAILQVGMKIDGEHHCMYNERCDVMCNDEEFRRLTTENIPLSKSKKEKPFHFQSTFSNSDKLTTSVTSVNHLTEKSIINNTCNNISKIRNDNDTITSPSFSKILDDRGSVRNIVKLLENQANQCQRTKVYERANSEVFYNTTPPISQVILNESCLHGMKNSNVDSAVKAKSNRDVSFKKKSISLTNSAPNLFQASYFEEEQREILSRKDGIVSLINNGRLRDNGRHFFNANKSNSYAYFVKENVYGKFNLDVNTLDHLKSPNKLINCPRREVVKNFNETKNVPTNQSRFLIEHFENKTGSMFITRNENGSKNVQKLGNLTNDKATCLSNNGTISSLINKFDLAQHVESVHLFKEKRKNLPREKGRRFFANSGHICFNCNDHIESRQHEKKKKCENIIGKSKHSIFSTTVDSKMFSNENNAFASRSTVLFPIISHSNSGTVNSTLPISSHLHIKCPPSKPMSNAIQSEATEPNSSTKEGIYSSFISSNSHQAISQVSTSRKSRLPTEQSANIFFSVTSPSTILLNDQSSPTCLENNIKQCLSNWKSKRKENSTQYSLAKPFEITGEKQNVVQTDKNMILPVLTSLQQSEEQKQSINFFAITPAFSSPIDTPTNRPFYSDSSQFSDSAISSTYSRHSECTDFLDDSNTFSKSQVGCNCEMQCQLHNQRFFSQSRAISTQTVSEVALHKSPDILTLGNAANNESIYQNGGNERSLQAAVIESTQLNDLSVRCGGSAVFQCRVFGIPTPRIYWTHNKQVIESSESFTIKYADSIAELVVNEACSTDDGEYTCWASNVAGSSSSSRYLYVTTLIPKSTNVDKYNVEGPVTTPPHIVSFSPSAACMHRGDQVKLTVKFTAQSEKKIEWFHNRKSLHTGNHFSIAIGEDSSYLNVHYVDASLSGEYTVVVANDLGSDSCQMIINIEDVPSYPVGKPYIYDVRKNSVSLSWCAPHCDGGSAITSYAIDVLEGTSGTWNQIASDCRDASYHILNLKNDETYEFKVRAGNKIGFGEPSLASDKVTINDNSQSSIDEQSECMSDVFFGSEKTEQLEKDQLFVQHGVVEIKTGRRFEDYYECVKEVGKGKFGVVHKCLDMATNKSCAAKVMKVMKKDKTDVQREIDVMNCLSHPTLVALLDAFEAEQTVVLVMEYVEGGELIERIIHDDFELTEQDCVHFVSQICCGVGFMHSVGILHLDLKPENILCVSNTSNHIKIIDFGMARFYLPGESLRVLHGTPEFMAPEVINFDEISCTTDMWSIGVITYILLSGISPFLDDTEAETLVNITCGEYDFDDESFDAVSESALDFIARLLVKQKEKRSTIKMCEEHAWLNEWSPFIHNQRLNTERHRNFMIRRKWKNAKNLFSALDYMVSSR